MFEYEILLSFAGEQRAQVEQVAECLRSSGIRVFYDNYEKADLWGKDLYQHFSDVYRKKGQYCIVFASKDYAEKAWTNHELRSAQARAFEEKGREYILPVRFDATEIPGIPPTVGYLNFDREGPQGICTSALRKLGIRTATQATPAIGPIPCDFSSKAYLHIPELQAIAFSEIERSSWGSEIELTASVESSEEDALFSKFRGQTKPMIVAYGFDVALAQIRSAERTTAKAKSTWNLKFIPTRTEFTDGLEMGTSSTTADEFAERRARRLLLDEYPVATDKKLTDFVAAADEAMKESLLQGIGTVVKIRGSLFSSLFKEYGDSPKEFLEIAWINASANLKLSASVEHIDRLKLSLDGTCLNVNFAGRRHRKYVNVDPYRIEISGRLPLVS
jgi:hypothetical protein